MHLDVLILSGRTAHDVDALPPKTAAVYVHVRVRMRVRVHVHDETSCLQESSAGLPCL